MIAEIEKSERKREIRLEECRMNVDVRDVKTKENIGMSQRRKREERLENGGRDKERRKKRERRDIEVGQTKARRERSAPDVHIRKRRWG